jgi:hypothetical protein
MEARFLWTLVATDMATGWGEYLPLFSRDTASVMTALRMLEELLPFPLRGIDVGNFPDAGGTSQAIQISLGGSRLLDTRSKLCDNLSAN